MKFNDYYTIVKPGVIYGNLFVALGAFFLASGGHIQLQLLCAVVVGLGLLMASAAVLNNWHDRDIDIAMERTRNRASVVGSISPRNMLIYAMALGTVGFCILFFAVNALAAVTTLFGLVMYFLIYTLFAKRTSHWGTLVGAISGAVPPVVGYVAVTSRFDMACAVLFLMLLFWQMPHAYAIALYRFNDYKAAGIPLLPIKRGVKRTKREMLLYIVLFGIIAFLLQKVSAVGVLYAATVALASLSWCVFAVYGFFVSDTTRWGRHMFFISLAVLMVCFSVMAVDASVFGLTTLVRV